MEGRKICVHCERLLGTHTDSKCLFESTHYEEMSQTQWYHWLAKQPAEVLTLHDAMFKTFATPGVTIGLLRYHYIEY